MISFLGSHTRMPVNMEHLFFQFDGQKKKKKRANIINSKVKINNKVRVVFQYNTDYNIKCTWNKIK